MEESELSAKKRRSNIFSRMGHQFLTLFRKTPTKNIKQVSLRKNVHGSVDNIFDGSVLTPKLSNRTEGSSEEANGVNQQRNDSCDPSIPTVSLDPTCSSTVISAKRHLCSPRPMQTSYSTGDIISDLSLELEKAIGEEKNEGELSVKTVPRPVTVLIPKLQEELKKKLDKKSTMNELENKLSKIAQQPPYHDPSSNDPPISDSSTINSTDCSQNLYSNNEKFEEKVPERDGLDATPDSGVSLSSINALSGFSSIDSSSCANPIDHEAALSKIRSQNPERRLPSRNRATVFLSSKQDYNVTTTNNSAISSPGFGKVRKTAESWSDSPSIQRKVTELEEELENDIDNSLAEPTQKPLKVLPPGIVMPVSAAELKKTPLFKKRQSDLILDVEKKKDEEASETPEVFSATTHVSEQPGVIEKSKNTAGQEGPVGDAKIVTTEGHENLSPTEQENNDLTTSDTSVRIPAVARRPQRLPIQNFVPVSPDELQRSRLKKVNKTNPKRSDDSTSEASKSSPTGGSHAGNSSTNVNKNSVQEKPSAIPSGLTADSPNKRSSRVLDLAKMFQQQS